MFCVMTITALPEVERRDLGGCQKLKNLTIFVVRPKAPKAGALPDCATPPTKKQLFTTDSLFWQQVIFQV
jgi:hypothetical protein